MCRKVVARGTRIRSDRPPSGWLAHPGGSSGLESFASKRPQSEYKKLHRVPPSPVYVECSRPRDSVDVRIAPTARG